MPTTLTAASEPAITLTDVHGAALRVARQDCVRYDVGDLAQRATIRYWQTFGSAGRADNLRAPWRPKRWTSWTSRPSAPCTGSRGRS